MDPPAKRLRLDSAAVGVAQPQERPRRSSRLSSRRQGVGNPLRLPFDILLVIFAFLTSPEDRKAVLLTCKEWYTAMSHHSLWHDSCIVIRKASSPLYLWQLLEARQIHSVSVKTLDGVDRSWYATLRKLEQVAPLSVTHLSVCIPPFNAPFKNISGTFIQLPHLKSLSLENCTERCLRQLESHHLSNIIELKLHSAYGNNCIDFVGLCDAVGSKLQRLSLNGFRLHQWVNNGLNNAVVVIDSLPVLVSLELIDCCSFATGPMVTKITDKQSIKYSPKFSLSELRITRTSSDSPSTSYHMLPLPVVSSTVLCQLSVLEVSNFELYDIKEVCRYWRGRAGCLQELNLSSNRLSGRNLEAVFRNAIQLKSLNLSSNRIGASMLKSDNFSRLPLESLMLAHSCLPVAKIPDLFPQLITLDLSGCSGLNDDTLHSMVKLKRLRILTAKYTTLSDRAVGEFRVHMKNKPRVIH